MSETEEITKYYYYQTGTQRYKVISIDNHDRTELRSSNSKIKKHECQQSA